MPSKQESMRQIAQDKLGVSNLVKSLTAPRINTYSLSQKENYLRYNDEEFLANRRCISATGNFQCERPGHN
jgi:hypothetical protein